MQSVIQALGPSCDSTKVRETCRTAGSQAKAVERSLTCVPSFWNYHYCYFLSVEARHRKYERELEN